MNQPRTDVLTDAEQKRLDELLSAARAFHHLNFLVASAAVAIAAGGSGDNIHVPVLLLALPRTQAAVAGYILSIALAILADRMFRLAYPWIRSDPRRVPFAWYALGFSNLNVVTISLWFLAPVIITSIAVMITLPGTAQDVGLVLPGFFLAATPRLIEGHLKRISQRLDHRGGPATLSMWLLYWYRLARNIGTCLSLVLFVLASIPSVRQEILYDAQVVIYSLLALMLIRFIAGFAFRPIDRLGRRFGFPETNLHDYHTQSLPPAV